MFSFRGGKGVGGGAVLVVVCGCGSCVGIASTSLRPSLPLPLPLPLLRPSRVQMDPAAVPLPITLALSRPSKGDDDGLAIRALCLFFSESIPKLADTKAGTAGKKGLEEGLEREPRRPSWVVIGMNATSWFALDRHFSFPTRSPPPLSLSVCLCLSVSLPPSPSLSLSLHPCSVSVFASVRTAS